MPHDEPVCPKCRDRMFEGFVIAESRVGANQTEWISGTPEPSVWTGVKLKGHQRLPVTTFRCPTCGFLEAYA